jgi:hypothetical protein
VENGSCIHSSPKGGNDMVGIVFMTFFFIAIGSLVYRVFSHRKEIFPSHLTDEEKGELRKEMGEQLKQAIKFNKLWW